MKMRDEFGTVFINSSASGLGIQPDIVQVSRQRLKRLKREL
jgi:hypothetical protein